jgi:hypothetical protein
MISIENNTCSLCKCDDKYVSNQIENTGLNPTFGSKFFLLVNDGMYLYFSQDSLPECLKHLKNKYLCDDCVDCLLYDDILEIDYINIWFEYNDIPDIDNICEKYSLDINKYKPDFRLNRVLRIPDSYSMFFPSKYPDNPLNCGYDFDQTFSIYLKMKTNPELFGEHSNYLVYHFLNYYENKYIYDFSNKLKNANVNIN